MPHCKEQLKSLQYPDLIDPCVDFKENELTSYSWKETNHDETPERPSWPQKQNMGIHKADTGFWPFCSHGSGNGVYEEINGDTLKIRANLI